MDVRRIKLNIGSNQLEIEGELHKDGSHKGIEEEVEFFKKLVAKVTGSSPTSEPRLAVRPQSEKGEEPRENGSSVSVAASPFAEIFKLRGKAVSLATPPQGPGREGDAFLLLLLGHRTMRGVDQVLVGDVKAGLQDSGFSVGQVDQITGTVSSELFIKTGRKRGKQFRLTNPGMQKAEALAKEILATIS